MGLFSALVEKQEPEQRRPTIENLFAENSGVIRKTYGTGKTKKAFTVISDEQFRMGFVKSLKPRENIWMRLGECFHHVGILRIGKGSATITVSPLGNEEVMRVGETRKFSTITRKMYDLKVTMKTVGENSARLFVQGIEEPIGSLAE